MGSTASENRGKGTVPDKKPASILSLILIGVGVLALILGVGLLLKTNPVAGRWSQSYDPTGHWWLSTLIAALPVLVLLGAMAGLRLKAHVAAVLGLGTALAVAIAVFHMPVRLALTSAAYGAGYGLFPICWIILPVIFLYQLTVKTGHFETLQQSLANITDDSRLQLLLIAFALGALFEGTAGFGTPVAVCGAILISLGFRPVEAAGLALIADTAPVAFGGLGIPIVALHGVTGLDVLTLSKVIAIVLTPFCFLVPFWLIWVYAGFKAMVEVWPAILVAGLTFSLTQLLMATYTGPGLVDIVAAMATIVALLAFLRVWKPRRVINARREVVSVEARVRFEHGAATTFKAWMPWLVLSVMVFVWGIPRFARWAEATTTVKIAVTGLDKVVERIPPVVAKPTAEAAVFNLNWLTTTGTAILVAAVLAGLLMGLGEDGVQHSICRVDDCGDDGSGVCDPVLRAGCNVGAGVRADGSALSVFRNADWMGGDGEYGVGYFIQCSVWQLAADDGAADWGFAGADVFGQFGRRRDGEDDRCAEHCGGQYGYAKLWAGGNDFALRFSAQLGAGFAGGSVCLSDGLCGAVYAAGG
jgi:L-lactate transport